MCRSYLVDSSDRLVLPDNVKPVKYDVHLKPNLKDFVFSGEEQITLNIVKPTKSIVIHSIEVEIASVEILGQKPSSIEFNKEEEVAVFNFDQELPVTTNAVLSIKFTGILNDKLKGFYRSQYIVDGEERYIATTQFEATDCRRAFPCFDEPALKAVFNIKITCQKEHIAISNMPETSIVENGDNTKTYTFDTTPIMSTYLVAFIIGDLEYVEGKTKGGIRVRVYKVKGIKESADFALDVGVKALDFFIDYFEIPYPLSKCDHVAIPDFAMGAMENWGLITYRQSILLTSEKTTLLTKQDIVGVIGHELAHQWFGNLVTMEWWSQLWLNEGFATFMGYLVTDYLFPEWNVWLEFSQSYRNEALHLDALESSHAIEVPVRSSSQINEIFDTISYNKGSCVIQMLEKRFGDSFRKGLTHYLNKHSYMNTKTEDLWESISLISGVDVKAFIDNFTKYPGYPVVSIKETSNGTYELSQKKFRVQGEEKPTDPIWNCFIKFQTDKGSYDFTLTKKSDTFTIPDSNPNGWIKPNYGQTGYFRIAYTPEIIKGLEPTILSLQLPAPDRLGLLSDVYNLCKSGATPISVFMNLVTSYKNEKEADVWNFIMISLNEISDLISDQDYYTQFNKIFIDLLKPTSLKLGFDTKPSDSSSDTLLRGKINGKLGALGDKDIVEESRKRFELYEKDQSSLDSNIRSCVLLTYVKNGGEAEQQKIIDLYRKTTDIAEKLALLVVIPFSPNEALVRKALEFSISKDVRSQDSYALWRVPNTYKPVVWKYLTENFAKINEIFGESGLFPYMISFSLTSKMSDEQYKEVENFFKEHPVPMADRSIKNDLEKIQNNTIWFNSFNSDLLNWIKNH
ncbi:hypothetical protein DICPUDRAFT_46283 [Dictyostelium purpureum]|uniref:Aminopeptidase n=1 Tax=Dictyostelium purpureum TaxID=5786 RepID=F0ZE42_DICPU|nr:uncharacterized protein DICPUDRAFT_46283 [Dictyostelium purpureum]EGC37760.1 hypothetical protein DICPUDRAFT_46283 [Dictyostelium purpureum]|eukprot:XP_003285699.1 hypothetical protein DICPUDRAFT_46283 [Dictyostelium purpureum]